MFPFKLLLGIKCISLKFLKISACSEMHFSSNTLDYMLMFDLSAKTKYFAFKVAIFCIELDL